MKTNLSTDYYQQSVEQVFKSLQTSKGGLNKTEAASRRQKNGPNLLAQTPRQSWLKRYLKQFQDFMIILLLASSVISVYLGDHRTAFVLLALVAFNTLISFSQEFKAEHVMDSLTRLTVTQAKVRRANQLSLIDSQELVPGDIVAIEEGDSVPADLRIFEETELATNDFALTGESNPSRKFTHAIPANVPLGRRNNQCFMGTTVAIGNGFGIVVATGMDTELGKIANLSQATNTSTSPLQVEINHIAKRVTQGTVLLCAVLLPIAIHADLAIKDAFLFAIGIASSIIPQGLPAEINTALSQAAGKLARARALVKKLSAVETLGSTSIICTDKTGTLTKNQMTVEKLLIGDQHYQVSGAGYEANGQIFINDKPLSASGVLQHQLFFITGVAASNAQVEPPDDNHADWYAIGDPTEAALITLARKAQIEPADFNKSSPELKEFTFDASRKLMSSVRHFGPKRDLHVFVKGAPETLLDKCNHILINGRIKPLTKARKKAIIDYANTLASDAMRNLGFAYKTLPAKTNIKTLKMEAAESQLTFLGLASMIDPLREEVPAAMVSAGAAHIAVSIITGDNAITAQAIAIKAGLAQSPAEITLVQGQEVADLSDETIVAITAKGKVIFSRVSPADKLRIVKLIKDSGRIVAVTGDGINDAPALKSANIGVAMGKTGTDVAKQSADIVLLDDSFNTLVGAIQQGRIVFQNIKKGTLSCFTSNSAELVVNLTSLAATSLLRIPLALTVMQILAIDIIAELFPIAALGWDKADHQLMSEPPRNPKAHILNKQSIHDLMLCGLIIGGLAFINYIWYFGRHGVTLNTVQAGSLIHMKATALTYLTIVMCQLGNIIQRRSSRGLFTRYQLHNKQFWLAIGLSMFCLVNIIYNPWIAPYFGAAALLPIDWLYGLGAAAIFLMIRELERLHSAKSTVA